MPEAKFSQYGYTGTISGQEKELQNQKKRQWPGENRNSRVYEVNVSVLGLFKLLLGLEPSHLHLLEDSDDNY